MNWASSAAIFLVSAAVTAVFFIQFCGTVFQCGCQPLWTTAAQHCNIHTAHLHHKGCPWCSLGDVGGALLFGPMLAAQAALAFLTVRLGWSAPKRLAASLLAFPGIGLVLALVLGIWTGYWN